MLKQKVEKEEFEQEDDLMAWKFAQESAQYWKEKLRKRKDNRRAEKERYWRLKRLFPFYFALSF
jgi:hypothetical protein